MSRPAGRSTSSASACEGVRVEEKVSTKRWYEVASGGREGEVTPRRFIITFCACTAGLVALCRDLLAKRSLLLMATGVAGGTRTFLLGGVDTSTVGDGSLHTEAAKSATTSLTGVQTPLKN